MIIILIIIVIRIIVINNRLWTECRTDDNLTIGTWGEFFYALYQK